MSCYRDIGTVQKPYQYIGHEENAYRKDFDAQRVRLCIAFPDAYEIGMSNVGMQIIYHVVNEQEGFLADRVYAPLADMGAMLKKSGQQLLSREAEKSLGAFDLLGFTLQYELCYTNVLYMLDLGGIPRRAKERGESDPLVLAGGPCAFNPEPVAAFFDFFVIGEGEDVIVELMDCLDLAKKRGLDRAGKLLALSRIKGIYVPSFYTPQYTEGQKGRFLKLERGPSAPRWVERRIIKDLDQVPYPTRPVTPAIQPIHERVSVEIQRGCTRSCRFCQAGYVYRPRRERNPNTVLSIIEKSVEATGITDIGLLSLSSADYSHIHPLMKEVMARFKKQRLSVSLPSTRLEALDESYLDVLREERRSGFTIAPEAGSQRLRNVINKNFTEAEVVETARMLFRNGWQTIKMYFMIGQPTETDEDVIAIAELGNTVIERCMDIPGRKSVTISVSNFVPKPHTPFQWHEQIDHAEIQRRQALVRNNLRYRQQLNFRSHSADNSLAEGLVARGDRRVADLIERAYELGAIFDCWQDKFDVALWRRAVAELLEETGHDFIESGLRGIDPNERLPWHRIYSGLHPKFFRNEYLKAIYGIATEDCSFASCHECGLCNEQSGVAPLVHKTPIEVVTRPARLLDDGGTASSGDEPAPRTFRFQHQKIGASIYLSTLDLRSLLIRAFTRSGLKISFDAGLRPRPRLTMGSALPLGVSSTCELFDIALETKQDAAAVLVRVNALLPNDLRLLTGSILDEGAASLSQLIRGVSYQVSHAELAQRGLSGSALQERIDLINASPRFIVKRARKSREGEAKTSAINLKDCVDALHDGNGVIHFTMAAPQGGAVNPFVVLDALFADGGGGGDRQIPVHKTGMHMLAHV